MTKKCTKCGEVKATEEYYKRMGCCKKCHLKRTKKPAKTHLGELIGCNDCGVKIKNNTTGTRKYCDNCIKKRRSIQRKSHYWKYPEKYRRIARTYNENNKDNISLKNKIYRQQPEVKERIKLKYQGRYKKNLIKYRNYGKKWHRKNSTKVSIQMRDKRIDLNDAYIRKQIKEFLMRRGILIKMKSITKEMMEAQRESIMANRIRRRFNERFRSNAKPI